MPVILAVAAAIFAQREPTGFDGTYKASPGRAPMSLIVSSERIAD